MSNNQGRTKPELALASALWRAGLRYLTAKGYKAKFGRTLYGQPDVIFTRKRVVVFVDGCFWHGCPRCRKSAGMKSEFWITKIKANKLRDLQVTAFLEKEGWRVVRIPEHDLKTECALSHTLDRLLTILGS